MQVGYARVSASHRFPMSPTLYMLVICSTKTLCWPVSTFGFNMTKPVCDGLIERHVHKDPSMRSCLACISAEELRSRFPWQPERPIGPIAH
jgi:hypothetical protein